MFASSHDFSKVEAERGKQKQGVLTETVPRKASRSLKNLKCCVPVSSHKTRAACQSATGGSMLGCCFTPRILPVTVHRSSELLDLLPSHSWCRQKATPVSSTLGYKESSFTPKTSSGSPSLRLPQGCSPPTHKTCALPFLERST